MGDKNPKKRKKPKKDQKTDSPIRTIEKKEVPTVKETKAHSTPKN